MKPQIIQQGAEAIIFLDKNQIIKQRIKKSYRIPEIDIRIRKLRTRNEEKLLDKASKIVPTPKVINVDEKDKEIIMEFIDGKKLSEYLNSFPFTKQKQICKQIGESVAKLHDKNIIHGDLTTSNMILFKKSSPLITSKKSSDSEQIFFIDFGLGFKSHKFEDKAVDIHLLKQALEAKHFKNWKDLFASFIKGYEKSEKTKTVLERLKAVEKRGRYKH